MKKIFFLIAFMALAAAVSAQQPIKINIIPSQGETPERARIAPASHSVVYFGKEPKTARYYLIIRPSDSFDYKAFRLFQGTADAIAEVQNASIKNDDGVLIAESPIGRITFSRFSDQGSLVLKKDSIILQKLPRE